MLQCNIARIKPTHKSQLTRLVLQDYAMSGMVQSLLHTKSQDPMSKNSYETELNCCISLSIPSSSQGVECFDFLVGKMADKLALLIRFLVIDELQGDAESSD